MSLPKLKVPIYNTTLPSGTKVKFRPYVIGEQKVLLMASEGEDRNEILNAIKTTVQVCVQIPNSFDVEKIPTFDLEYLLMKIRSKSVSESIDIKLKCPKCKKRSKVQIDITKDIKVIKDKKHNKLVKITDNIGIVMNYPTMNMKIDDSLSKMDADIELIKLCIESIYENDNVSKITDDNRNELDVFISSLTNSQYEKIVNFFKTSPNVKCLKDWECSNEECKHKNKFVLDDIEDFFI